MRKVLQGTKVSRETSVNGNKVSVIRTTEHKKFGEVINNWTFDFSGVNPDEIMVLATRPLVITTQAQLRAAKTTAEADKFDTATFSVRDFLDRERAKLSPEEKFERAVAGLPPEKVKEILEAQLKALQGGKS